MQQHTTSNQPKVPPSRDEFDFQQLLPVSPHPGSDNDLIQPTQWLEFAEAITLSHLNALGLPPALLQAQLNARLLVRHVELDCLAPAQLHEPVVGGARLTHIGSRSLQWQLAYFRQDTLLAHMQQVCVLVAQGEQGQLEQQDVALPLPEPLRAALTRAQQGTRHDAVTLRIGAWDELLQPAREVRQLVFVQEQGISQALEWDDLDAVCTHTVVFNALDQPIATARLLPDGRIGRVAVLRALRGYGFGLRVMAALEAHARQLGHAQVTLHAQRSAEGFYQRLGYVVEGEAFIEAGVEHVTMHKTLGAMGALGG